jgi:hypothetical protein
LLRWGSWGFGDCIYTGHGFRIIRYPQQKYNYQRTIDFIQALGY